MLILGGVRYQRKMQRKTCFEHGIDYIKLQINFLPPFKKARKKVLYNKAIIQYLLAF